MKSILMKVGVFAFLFVGITACSQKNETKQNVTTDTVTVEKDSATIAAEKKKEQDAEKAKLPKPYDPKEDAEAKIAELVKQAQAENKNIMMQAGGNWCIWCLRFNQFVQETPELKNIVDENYIYYHLNYSPDNKNEKVFAKYGDPGKKFGYPVFIILDKDGNQIHTQESGSLEEGKGYSIAKVKEFFEAWKPKG